MSANPSEPTEQESNIPLDDLIKKLADTVEKLTEVIVKAPSTKILSPSVAAATADCISLKGFIFEPFLTAFEKPAFTYIS